MAQQIVLWTMDLVKNEERWCSLIKPVLRFVNRRSGVQIPHPAPVDPLDGLFDRLARLDDPVQRANPVGDIVQRGKMSRMAAVAALRISRRPFRL